MAVKKTPDLINLLESKSKKYILNNNLRLMLVPKKSAGVTVGIFINAGSNNENKNNNGIAHFLEHLMFKGTKKRPSIKLVQDLDSIGGKYNAMTGKEFTGYYVSGNYLDTANIIDIIVDIYCNSTFTESAIDKERSVILEEMNMGLNSPNEILLNKMHEKIFWHTPMALPTIGSEKNIKFMKRDDFIQFRKKYYVPSNAIMVICGNINPKKVYSLIQKKFKLVGNIWKESKSDDLLTNLHCHLEQTKPYIYLKNMPIAQTQVLIAFRTIPNARGLDILSDILTTGLSSRLFMALRQKLGATYSVDSGYLGYKNDGIFAITYGIDNLRVSESVVVILKELHKLKKGIKQKEIDKAIKTRKTSLLLSLQNPTDITFFHGLNEIDLPMEGFLKRKNIVKEIYQNYEHTTEKNLKKLIFHTFNSFNFNLFVYGNTNNIKKGLKKIETYVRDL